MALFVFGDPYYSGGDWNVQSNWKRDLPESSKSGWQNAGVWDRLPTQSDTIIFLMYVTSNWPTTWSGTVANLKVNGGTWTGQIHTGIINITNTIVSGTITNLYTQLGALSSSSMFYYWVGNYSGAGITMGGSSSISSTIPVGSVITMGGTSTISGTVTTFSSLTISDNAIISNPITKSNTIYQYGGTINCLSANDYNSTGGINNSSSFNCLNYTATNCNYSGNLTANAIILTDSSLLGTLTFNGTNTTAKLTVQGNCTIAADISTAATGNICTKYNLYGGTYTNSAPWIFGKPSLAATVDIGHKEVLVSGTTYIQYNLTNLNKDITIYARPKTGSGTNELYGIYFYRKSTRTGAPLGVGTITGQINFIYATGYSSYSLTIQGGTYAPSAILNPTVTNGNYTISSSNLLPDYGFALNATFSPTYYISNLPSGIDILSTQI